MLLTLFAAWGCAPRAGGGATTANATTTGAASGSAKPAPALAHAMLDILRPRRASIWTALELGPPSAIDWPSLQADAEVLRQTSVELEALEPRPAAAGAAEGSHNVWVNGAARLRHGSGLLLRAVEAQDPAAARAAFGEISGSCGGCHRECSS